jgi:hypothetical protein
LACLCLASASFVEAQGDTRDLEVVAGEGSRASLSAAHHGDDDDDRRWHSEYRFADSVRSEVRHLFFWRPNSHKLAVIEWASRDAIEKFNDTALTIDLVPRGVYVLGRNGQVKQIELPVEERDELFKQVRFSNYRDKKVFREKIFPLLEVFDKQVVVSASSPDE